MQGEVKVETDLLRVAAGAHIHRKRSVPWKLTRPFADLRSEPPGSLGQKATVTSNSISCSALLLSCHLASKDFPYFPAMSACYCSLRKLIKKI